VLALEPKKVILLENHNTALFYIDKEQCAGELRQRGEDLPGADPGGRAGGRLAVCCA